MSTYTRTSRFRFPFDLDAVLSNLTARIRIPRTSLFVLVMIGALIAFESFNFGTTEFALRDLLGDLQFATLRWSTILALAFCGMDFAGIARLFSPQAEEGRTLEVWYLLGAWLLAATMNAVLTWWAVSLALLSHSGLGNEILGREALLSSVPLFVAVLVWLIRILMIGTFTMTSSSFSARALFRGGRKARPATEVHSMPVERPQRGGQSENSYRSIRPAPKPAAYSNGTQRSTPQAARSRTNR
jgi:hypothetical protein